LVTAAIIDGGFDPVAIEASVGEELSLAVHYSAGRTEPISVKVPPRRPPVVVRTVPSRGRIDVALNAQIAIVFSEPVDKASVTTASVALTQGGSLVSGSVKVTPDGLGASFIPDSPLQPATEYSLKVDSGIRDLDGEALAETTIVDFETATLSPTAQLVFTSESDRQIYQIGADGTGLTRLTTEGENSRAVFSPDGSQIAFARHQGNDGDIYTMNADGTGVVRRTVGAKFWSVEWSPDGTKLLASDEDVYYASISIIDLNDPAAPPRLLASAARTPAWSPDGKQIAFVRTSGDDGYHQIFIMNPDGTDQRPVTIWDSGGIYGLSWSPDGERLAFSKCLIGCALYTMRADGSDWKTITELPTAGGAKWSPDGKWIAFTIDNYSAGGWDWHPTIAYVSADGGPVHVITSGYSPSWQR
jgi:Tol biopolymer transport system component